MKCWLLVAIVVVTACFLVLAVGGSDGTATRHPVRVLLLAPIGSRSHKNFFMAVANALADRGNQVTVVSTFEPTKHRENIHEVVVRNFSLDHYIPNVFSVKAAGIMSIFMQAPNICNEALAKKEAQDLLHQEYDVVLISRLFSHCFLSLVHSMKVPFIWISPSTPTGITDVWMGNPPFTAFTGFVLMEARHPLTFSQRMLVALADSLLRLVADYYLTPRMEDICRSRGLCPDDMPSLQMMQYNASLMITNGVRTLDYPGRPSMPNIIQVGGIHCRPANPLPQDLEEWVEGAGEDGFILFSLGTVVRMSDMHEKYRQILVKVFGSLKQRVLWKWDQDTMPDLPPNVRLGKWLPQQDILGHPSIRLFITHGGLLSTLESTFHGVPVLGLPFGSDQLANMREVVQEGWGQVLHWDQLTEETFEKAIHTAMEDQSIRAETKRRSRVMKDQMASPGDVASFWVEYVVRHNGAPHLRSPILSMAWYQVYNVDVWLVLVTLVLLLIFLILKLIFALCSRLFSSFRSRTKNKKE